MKVFKFYSGDEIYAFSGNTEEQAKESLFYDIGEMEIDKCEEIPESEWDNRFIVMHEDNDLEKEPFLMSIRELMDEDLPHMIFSNVMD